MNSMEEAISRGLFLMSLNQGKSGKILDVENNNQIQPLEAPKLVAEDFDFSSLDFLVSDRYPWLQEIFEKDHPSAILQRYWADGKEITPRNYTAIYRLALGVEFWNEVTDADKKTTPQSFLCQNLVIEVKYSF